MFSIEIGTIAEVNEVDLGKETWHLEVTTKVVAVDLETMDLTVRVGVIHETTITGHLAIVVLMATRKLIKREIQIRLLVHLQSGQHNNLSQTIRCATRLKCGHPKIFFSPWLIKPSNFVYVSFGLVSASARSNLTARMNLVTT